MLNMASYNKQIEREEWIKRFGMRSSTLCAVLFIAAVMYLAVQWGYDGTARFTVFCAAAAVYLLCKWVCTHCYGSRQVLDVRARRLSAVTVPSLRYSDAAMCSLDAFISIVPRGQVSVTLSFHYFIYLSFLRGAMNCQVQERAFYR